MFGNLQLYDQLPILLCNYQKRKHPVNPLPHTYTTGKAKGGPAIPSGMKNGEGQTRRQVVETWWGYLTWAHHDAGHSGRNSSSQDETSLAVTLRPPACSSLLLSAHLATCFLCKRHLLQDSGEKCLCEKSAVLYFGPVLTRCLNE